MKHAIFTDSQGRYQCGSDKIIPLDGRFGIGKITMSIMLRRNGFKKNFPEKYNSMTHFAIWNGSFQNMPDKFEKCDLIEIPDWEAVGTE